MGAPRRLLYLVWDKVAEPHHRSGLPLVPFYWKLFKNWFPKGCLSPPLQAQFWSPHTQTHTLDNTQNGTNDAHLPEPWSTHKTITNLESMAPTWEKLLYCSGGALELSKCSYYILQWHWPNGLPRFLPCESTSSIKKISLTLGASQERTIITQREPNEAHCTLGVWLAPGGNKTAQYIHLKSMSHSAAHLIARSNLSKLETHMAYSSCWLPSVGYSLAISTLSNPMLCSIQARPTSKFLLHMGLNAHFPCAICFGPIELGG